MGDVTELLKGIDDRFAIFGSGEEIAAEFDAAKLPALPAGGSAITSFMPTGLSRIWIGGMHPRLRWRNCRFIR